MSNDQLPIAAQAREPDIASNLTPYSPERSRRIVSSSLASAITDRDLVGLVDHVNAAGTKCQPRGVSAEMALPSINLEFQLQVG